MHNALVARYLRPHVVVKTHRIGNALQRLLQHGAHFALAVVRHDGALARVCVG